MRILRKQILRGLFCVTCLAVLSMTSFGFAQDHEPTIAVKSYPALQRGMRFYDVVRLWGAPQQKKKDTSGFQEAWIYGNGKVIFQQGSVVAWVVPEGSQTEDYSQSPSETEFRQEMLSGKLEGQSAENGLDVPDQGAEPSKEKAKEDKIEDLIGELLNQ